MSQALKVLDGRPQDRNAAFLDSMTQLPNRRWLWTDLKREVRRARRSDYRFAVLFIDVDRFKEVNDSYGHLAGDKVLRAIVRHVRASVRAEDEVFRYGGDEFIVLMKDIRTPAEVRQVARRIGRAVNTAGVTFEGRKWRLQVTLSIGAAISSGFGSSSVEAVERADRAMYQAKALGRRGRFVVDDFAKKCSASGGNRKSRSQAKTGTDR
jgi:diguanylate cyclase (GGDEF)-like protein